MKKLLILLLALTLLTACGAKPAAPKEPVDTAVVCAGEHYKISVEQPVCPVGTQLVTVVLENTSERTLMYGRSYTFHKEVDGVWTALPAISNAAFTMEGLLLEPGKSVSIQYSTWFLQQPQLSEGTYLLTGSTLTLLGQSGDGDENLDPWQVTFTVSPEAGDLSTYPLTPVPAGVSSDFFLQVDPPAKGEDALFCTMYYSGEGNAEILLIPTLYRQNEAGDWEEIPVDEQIGFCGTPDPLPVGEKTWAEPVSTLWGNLYAGEYRLSYTVTSSDGVNLPVMSQFTLTEDICRLPRTE